MKTTEEQLKEMTENALILYVALKAIITTMQTEHTFESFEATMKPIMLQAQETLAKIDAK